MTQVQEQMKGLTFLFESEASASFLVIQCESKIIEYQMQMLEHNLIRHIIPPEIVRKEGVNHFYYNITSKISLSFFLRRSKLSRDEFLKLLLQITTSVNDSSGYLLGISNFIFDPEYIYINPETLEPALIYVPASTGQNGCEVLRSFISDLLLQHIHVDGFDKGNFVQRILSAVNSNIFSIKACVALMNELMYGQEHNSTAIRPAGPIQPALNEKDNTQASLNYNKNKKEENKEAKKNKIVDTNRTLFITIAAVLLQFVMGVVIYLSREFLQRISDNQTATFAAVAMIVLAVDVLLYRKISDAKLISVNSKPTEPAQQKESDEIELVKLSSPSAAAKISESFKTVHESVYEGVHETAAVKCNVSGRMTNYMSNQLSDNIPDSIPDNIPNHREPASAGAEKVIYKTELLAINKKGSRLLRSTGRNSLDEDITIDKDDFIIGRLAGHVDHILNNNAVGKLHAELIYRNGACFVKDLNSVNGTFINNTRIESNKEVELKENDRLQLANSEFMLVYG